MLQPMPSTCTVSASGTPSCIGAFVNLELADRTLDMELHVQQLLHNLVVMQATCKPDRPVGAKEVLQAGPETHKAETQPTGPAVAADSDVASFVTNFQPHLAKDTLPGPASLPAIISVHTEAFARSRSFADTSTLLDIQDQVGAC